MITEIKNLAQLREQRSRIKFELENTSQQLKDDIEDIKQNFNPIKTILGYTKNLIFTNNNKNGLVDDGIRSVIGNIVHGKLLKFLPWPIRIVASFALKNVASNYVSKNKGNIIDKGAALIGNIKKLFFKNKSTYPILKIKG